MNSENLCLLLACGWGGIKAGIRRRHRFAAITIRAEKLVGKRIGTSGDSENSCPSSNHLVGVLRLRFLGPQTPGAERLRGKAAGFP